MDARVVEGLENLPAEARGCVLTIGNFDGVHVGHQRILQTARALADSAGSKVCAFTFEPAPVRLLAPQQAEEGLMPKDVRYRLLGECGVDLIAVINTTRQFLALSAEQFVREVICGCFEASRVVEGPDFRFGRGRAGSVQTLRQMAGECGFEVTQVGPASIALPGRGELRISSSLIRGLLRGGDVEAAGRCLGRPYTLYGRIISGERRGRLLEFPTANVDAGDMVCPGDGVYAATARIGGDACPSAVSIGAKLTFGPAARAIEVHLIGAGGDFYGRSIEVTFLARLREQEKFPDADSLREQIAKDIQRVREICG